MKLSYAAPAIVAGLLVAAGLTNVWRHSASEKSNLPVVTMPNPQQVQSFTLPRHGVTAFANGVLEVRLATGQFTSIERIDLVKKRVSSCNSTSTRMPRDLIGNRVDPCALKTKPLSNAFIDQGDRRAVFDAVRAEAEKREGFGQLAQKITFALR